ncbi:MAG: N4-gp56 family major capsid protein [Planctomycetes bacterium]|nr:N4-gp56 family major capsid protein [Planctomycetota bacterium]
MAITNVAQIPYPVNYNLMREMLLTAKVRCPFYYGTNQGTLGENQGTASVKWERIENLTKVTTPLTELTGTLSLPTRTSVQPTITPITATMLKYGNSIKLTEELELMSVNARASKFMSLMGENAGQSYNAVMESVFSGCSAGQTRWGNGVASDALTITAIAANDLQYANNLINRQGGHKFHPDGFGSTNIGTSPVRSSYMGICHVDVSEDLRAISGWQEVTEYGGYVATFPNEIGHAKGIRWCETELDTLISADAGTTSAAGFRGTSDVLNDVYNSYVFGMDAVGSVGLGDQHTKEIYMSGDRIPAVEVIYHGMGTSGVADVLNEIGSIGWKGWLVGKILQNDWLVKINTLASDLS